MKPNPICGYFIVITYMVGYEFKTVSHFLTVTTATVNNFQYLTDYVPLDDITVQWSFYSCEINRSLPSPTSAKCKFSKNTFLTDNSWNIFYPLLDWTLNRGQINAIVCFIRKMQKIRKNIQGVSLRLATGDNRWSKKFGKNFNV